MAISGEFEFDISLRLMQDTGFNFMFSGCIVLASELLNLSLRNQPNVNQKHVTNAWKHK